MKILTLGNKKIIKNPILFKILSLSILLIVSMAKADSTYKISYSKTSLLTHITNDATTKQPLQNNIPKFSTIWSSLGYGKTKDTSDQDPGSSRSNDSNIA